MASPTNQPKPTTDTLHRVFRGGSWGNFGPSWVRAASRSTDVPAGRGNVRGFRCALRGRQPRV